MARDSHTSNEDARGRVIVALDVPDAAQARDLVTALGDVITFYKVGLYLQMARGTEAFIDELIAAGKDVFLDYKLGDIGESMRGGIAGAAARGVRFLTIQGSEEVAKAGLAAVLRERADDGPRILMVTVLTSVGLTDLKDIYGPAIDVPALVLRRARLARELGCDGVIASGQEARRVREELGPDYLIVTPGVRPASGAVAGDDQKRAVTPGKAIAAGADHIVVGRPIVRSANPVAAAQSIVDEVAEAIRVRAER